MLWSETEESPRLRILTAWPEKGLNSPAVTVPYLHLPTRYSFLTGTYAFRGKNTGIAPPSSPSSIPEETYTLPDLLKQAGYKTAVVGKWHLGLGAQGVGPLWNDKLKPGPREIGFDYNFLLPTTNDRVPQVYVENHRVLNLDPKDPLWVGMKKPSEDHPTGITHRDTLKMDWTRPQLDHPQRYRSHWLLHGRTCGPLSRRRFGGQMGGKIQGSGLDETKDQPFPFFASHDLHVPRIPHEALSGNLRLKLSRGRHRTT